MKVKKMVDRISEEFLTIGLLMLFITGFVVNQILEGAVNGLSKALNFKEWLEKQRKSIEYQFASMEDKMKLHEGYNKYLEEEEKEARQRDRSKF